MTVLAFKTGVAVSADLWLGDFDTYANHDPDHEWLFGNLTDSVDYLWEYAEEHGVADRMAVVMGSDFGRTNFYNAGAGKDHWPIGRFIVMEKDQSWTGRAVGKTDGRHFAHRINPCTLRRDDTGGTIIYPKHAHKALRRYFGIERSPGALRLLRVGQPEGNAVAVPVVRRRHAGLGGVVRHRDRLITGMTVGGVRIGFRHSHASGNPSLRPA